MTLDPKHPRLSWMSGDVLKYSIFHHTLDLFITIAFHMN